MNPITTYLDNGLQLIVHESRVAPVASFWIFYRVGSRNEQPGLTGISHWVEHMLFKGTDRFPRGEFDKAVARAGGIFNGMTGQDWTTYFETFPAVRIELALQVESDRMVNALFDEAECESERSVILSEREGSENDPFWRLSTETQAAAFLAHAYRHPIIGWTPDLLAIRRADLLHHYRTYYTPDNAIAVAVGDFDSEAMLALIERHFGPIPAGPSRTTTLAMEPVQSAERRVLLRGSDPPGYLVMSFPAPAASHPDFFPLIILDAVLGGAKGLGVMGGGGNNRSNRLYRALVEEGLTVDADSAFHPTIDPHLFTFGVTLAPNVDHEQVEAAIWAELMRVQAEGVTAAELAKAVQQTKTQFALSSESVTGQAYWLGFSEIVADGGWLKSWYDRLAAVTIEYVQRVASDYYRRERQTVGWYLPESNGGDDDE